MYTLHIGAKIRLLSCKISIWLRESPDHKQLQNDMQAFMVAYPAQYWIGSKSYSGTRN